MLRGDDVYANSLEIKLVVIKCVRSLGLKNNILLLCFKVESIEYVELYLALLVDHRSTGRALLRKFG